MRPPNTTTIARCIVVLFVCIGAWMLYTTHLAPKATPTPQETEKIARLCANLEYGDEEIPLPITCTLPIRGNETVEFTFQADGGLVVRRGDTVLLNLTAAGGDSLSAHTAALAYTHEPILRPDGFVLQDITFDGYADLQVMTFAGAYNFGYDFYAYNPKTRTFDLQPILTEVVNPGVDTEKKEIVYFYKGRGLADMFSAGTYQFKNGVYILTSLVEQDMVSGYDDPNPLYERITSELQSGEMVVVKKETLTAKDVWGE